ncbi:hypothetical protein DIZ81_06970 [Legionella taurinensis]|uniref:Uncharacterized protein n=1 Tax=Legionella taurinensis TaxID=70611 RepID=A0A3A5L355_9GAMM|nr:hypothetical protein [Legionella taurinensis]MDX1837186.1 hypothetical protein [Legionella taurinensis]PUT40339.1 hypothetical protein DB744_06970 [Legionella taurinensis]PUT41574.1 hypothetical protein DB746_09480 [Legionella taurinensis]PUT44439.1 hypothetical protein DB743_08695 [Legionella taurinensis]PUT48401.1 hypothetical protein DB745_05370 [Legionella taurinensis]
MPAEIKEGYRPDNNDTPPEGSAYTLIQRILNVAGAGSIQQVVRAAVDDSGAKTAGANSDETDVTNNSEGFILSGDIEGSLHATLQGHNLMQRYEEQKETEENDELLAENTLANLNEKAENTLEAFKQFVDTLQWANKHFPPLPK